jgi:putative oxidoreductase
MRDSMHPGVLCSGRILLTLAFVAPAVCEAESFSSHAAAMAERGVPLAGLVLSVWLALTLIGGVGLALGFRTRVAIGLLVAATLLSLLVDGGPSGANLGRAAGLLGGLLLVYACGPGDWSLDGRRRRPTDFGDSNVLG